MALIEDNNNTHHGNRSEIAFFDLETTVPGRAIVEFGSILVCPRKLKLLDSYSTLVRPIDPYQISTLPVRYNGITRDAVSTAPFFADVADKVYDILHGRIWAGHNIRGFDCKRIEEAFAEIGRPAPEPKDFIDTYQLLTQSFGRRAGNMKLASLANYFGLGQQTHRSLDDVKMNLEVVKCCATVLFLEWSLPDISNSSPVGVINENSPPSPQAVGFPQNHPILSLGTESSEEEASDSDSSYSLEKDPFDMSSFSDSMSTESLQADVSMDEKQEPESTVMSAKAAGSESFSEHAGFLGPNQISIPSISASLVPWFRGIQRIQLLHRDVPLQLHCADLKVRFGIRRKYYDQHGRPQLTFVVDTSPSLCRILEACDKTAQNLFVESNSSSEWKNVVSNHTARLRIPTAANGENITQYTTEIHQKETSGATQKLIFRKFDPAELAALFKPGTSVDAFFSLDTYDYKQNAGIRLVAKKLIIPSP